MSMTTSQVKALVDKGSLDLNVFKQKFQASHKKPLLLDEPAMISVIAANIGTDGKFSLKKMNEAFAAKQDKSASVSAIAEAANTANAKSVAITASSSRLINEIVALLDKDASLHDHMVNLTRAKGEVASTPILVYRDMQRLLGTKIDEMPLPGSSYKDGDVNPDIRKVMRKDKDGSSKPKDVSWYTELAESVSYGVFLADEAKAIGSAVKSESISDKRFQHYAGYSSEQLTNAASTNTSAKKNLRTSIMTAVNLHVQLANVSSKLPHIRVKLSDDAKSYKPIFTSDVQDQDKFKALTVSGFLRLNVDRAVQKGGSIGEFWASGQAEPDPGKNAPAMSIADADESIASWAIFVSTKTRYKELDELLGNKENEGVRSSFETIYEKFEALYQKHKALIERERRAREAQEQALAQEQEQQVDAA